MTAEPSITAEARLEARRAQPTRMLLRGIEDCLESPTATFTDLSIERLTEAAGVSRSTFYLHFASKYELLEVLAAEAVDEISDAARIWLSLRPDRTKADVREALERIADAYRSHHVVMGAIIEVAVYDESVRRRFAELVESGRQVIASHIAEGHAAGFVDPRIDPVGISKWLTWMMERGLQRLVVPADAARTEALIGALTDIVWNAVYAGAESS